jgi:CMP-2-keto-3-deoxyoctulosonic acid synthetase
MCTRPGPIASAQRWLRCVNVPNTLIVIPARMQATRLPGKPMVDIGGAPMIVQVWRRAVAANAGRVVVATDAAEVVSAIEAAGGEAVMTRADHVSGSDRIFEAVTRIDPDARADIVVNLQGDLPTLEPHLVAACVGPLSEAGTDIATLAAEIVEAEERSTSRAPPLLPATARSTTTSAFTRTGARRLNASCRCNLRRSNCARSSNNCAHWKPACAST